MQTREATPSTAVGPRRTPRVRPSVPTRGPAASQVALVQRKAGNRAASAMVEVLRREDPGQDSASPAAEVAAASPEAQTSPAGAGDPAGGPSGGGPAGTPGAGAGAAAGPGSAGAGPDGAGAGGGAPGGGPGPGPQAKAGPGAGGPGAGGPGGPGAAAGPTGPVGGAPGVGTAGAGPGGPAAKAGPGADVGGGDGGGGAALEAFRGKAAAAGTALKKKQPSSTHVGQMQGAAKGPANEQVAGGKAAQVDDMDAAPPGTFDKAAFIAAVEKAIAANAPKNLEEADNMSDSGKMGQVKESVQSQVGDGKEQAAGQVEEATDKPPDASRGEKKPVKPMPAMAKARKPGAVGAAKAMPKPKPAAATDLSAPAAEVDGQMAAEDVTEEQLAQSEEPEFIGALEAKKAGDQHSKQAPGPVRAEEAQILGQAKAEAGAAEQQGLDQMTGAKQNAVGAVGQAKEGSKTKDEAARKKVADQIEQIYSKTQAETKKILDGLDKKVDDTFTKGEAAARQKFEQKHKKDFQAWKDKRYSGWGAGLKWAKDKLFGVPAEANRIFDKARKIYLAEMKGVIASVAEIVSTELNAAKARIAQGRTEVADYVASLPNDLKSVGADLADDLQAKFDQLDSDVDAKNDEMVQAVANKHKEATDAVDAKIAELKAANSGLWNKAKAAIAAVINTIKQLKQAITTALKSAADAISLIIKNPKKFLTNLINAVKTGLQNFVGNIWDHLKKGFFGWLTGAVAEAGIKMPESFDLKGIIGLIVSVMGVTWTAIKSKIIKRLAKKFGPKAEAVIGKIEGAYNVIAMVATEGPGALWQLISQKVSNIWDLVVTKLQDFLITKVITAGITWIIGILNPAAGFIKICKAIVDIVMWFWNNASRIAELVSTIASSAKAIAQGSIGAAAKAVENVLVKMLPMAIGFLASLLGLGGIAGKVRDAIKTVQKPITKVINSVVDKAVKLGKKFLRTGLGKKLKAGYGKAKKKVKDTFEKAKAKGEAAVQKVKKKVYGGDDSPEGKRARLELALRDTRAIADKYRGKKAGRALLEPRLAFVKRRRGVGVLDLIPAGPYWAVEARVDRTKEGTEIIRVGEPPDGAPTSALTAESIAHLQSFGLVGIPTALSQAAEHESSRLANVARNKGLPKKVLKIVNPAGGQWAASNAKSVGDFLDRWEYLGTSYREIVAAEPDPVRDANTSPSTIHANRLLEKLGVDTNDMETQLEADVQAVEETAGIGWVPLPTGDVIAATKSVSGSLSFGSGAAAAYHPKKHAKELPESERSEGRDFQTRSEDYITSARRTIAEGSASSKDLGTATKITFRREVIETDLRGEQVTRRLRTIVMVRSGHATIATSGSEN